MHTNTMLQVASLISGYRGYRGTQKMGHGLQVIPLRYGTEVSFMSLDLGPFPKKVHLKYLQLSPKEEEV